MLATISLCVALMEPERLSGGLMDCFSFRSLVIHKILMDPCALLPWICSIKQSPLVSVTSPSCFGWSGSVQTWQQVFLCLYVSSDVNSLQQLLRFTHRCYKRRFPFCFILHLQIFANTLHTCWTNTWDTTIFFFFFLLLTQWFLVQLITSCLDRSILGALQQICLLPESETKQAQGFCKAVKIAFGFLGHDPELSV